jgi:hypothetical protein
MKFYLFHVFLSDLEYSEKEARVARNLETFENCMNWWSETVE